MGFKYEAANSVKSAGSKFSVGEFNANPKVKQLSSQTTPTVEVSNTNPVVNSKIEPSTPQLAASGQNQALTKPFSQLSSIEKEQLLFNR